MLYEWAFLAFKKYARFQALYIVPNILRDIRSVSALFVTQDAGLHNLSLIVIGGYFDLALQDNHCLVLCGMVMHRNESAWLHSIEEAVTLVGKALVEIVVLPQPWRNLCLLGKIID